MPPLGCYFIPSLPLYPKFILKIVSTLFQQSLFSHTSLNLLHSSHHLATSINTTLQGHQPPPCSYICQSILNPDLFYQSSLTQFAYHFLVILATQLQWCCGTNPPPNSVVESIYFAHSSAGHMRGLLIQAWLTRDQATGWAQIHYTAYSILGQ